jgi:hypothetical protein
MWLSSLFGKRPYASRSRRPGQTRRPMHRPRLEALEDRLAPATFTVTSTTDGDPGSLRAAILAANATPGASTIVVPAGDYQLTLAGAGEDGGATGDLDIQGDLTVQGARADSTTIDGLGLDRVFEVFGGTVAFSGLTIEHGRAAQGAGVLSHAGAVSLSDCNLTYNTAAPDGNASSNDGQGGAIASLGGTLEVHDCTISHNRAFGDALTGGDGQGGGIYIVNGALTVTHDSVLFENWAIGGSVGSGQGGDGQGGGIYAASSTLTLTNCTIADQFSGGLSIGGAIGGSVGSGQGGDGQGGGIYAASSTLTLTNCTFSVDTAAGGYVYFQGEAGTGQGGGIYASGCTLSLSNCTLSGDTARGGGGDGFQFQYDFFGNIVGVLYGGVQGGAGQGGGIYAANSTLTLNNTSLTSDVAAGGGVSFLGKGGAGQGGGIYATSSPSTLTNCTLAGDTAQGGGGSGSLLLYYVTFSYTSTGFTYDFHPVVFSGGVQGGDGQGGGIYTAGSALTLAGSDLTSDLAAGGGVSFLGAGGAGQGGGFYAANATLSVTNCALGGDTAQGGGGSGVLVADEVVYTFTWSTWSWSVSFSPIVFYGGVDGGDGDGGGICALDSTLTVTHSQFTGDDALAGTVSYGVNGDGFGGGLDLDSTLLVLRNTTFSGDLATTAGNNTFTSP